MYEITLYTIDMHKNRSLSSNNQKKGRTVPEGYVRADSLDKKKLQKYIKGVATEAELHRDARKNEV